MLPLTMLDDELSSVLGGIVIVAAAVVVFVIAKFVKSDSTVTRAGYETRTATISPPRRNLRPDQVGVRFNGWRSPVAVYGPGEEHLEEMLCCKLSMQTFDICPEEWHKATEVVDIVLRMLFSEVAQLASQYRINIDKFVRQGSAREGLKVRSADEFDSLLLFSIDGLEYEVQKETDERERVLSEIGKLRVVCPRSTFQLECDYPKLHLIRAFRYDNGVIYLNSKILHERVFTAIIDRAKDKIRHRIDSSPAKYRFSMTRAINPPSVNVGLTFELTDAANDLRPHLRAVRNNWHYPTVVQEAARDNKYHIDIDIVPALLIQNDRVPDPTEYGQYMDCPRYAVFKWVRDTHPFVFDYNVEPDTIWRMDSSGYEKHILDVAHGSKEQRYILTAARILKAYFLYEKRKYKNSSDSPPPQIVTVLRSYFLKQLAFYCILYYPVLHKYRVSGVREALTILLDLLQICLEEQRLPHFFHTNPWLSYIFPDYNVGADSLRYDLFYTIKREALNQAKLYLKRHTMPSLRDFTCELCDTAYNIQDKFREFVKE